MIYKLIQVEMEEVKILNKVFKNTNFLRFFIIIRLLINKQNRKRPSSARFGKLRRDLVYVKTLKSNG
jgi:hypothetical protein